MYLSEKCLDLPLRQRPEIRRIGFNIHGNLPVEKFFMKDLWSLHLYHWQGKVEFEGESFPICPGHFGLCPPNTQLTWYFPRGQAPHYYAHIYFPESFAGGIEFPVMRDMGARSKKMDQSFEAMIGLYAVDPLRAEIRLWDFLWSTLDGSDSTPSSSTLPNYVQTAVAIIDNELRSDLSPSVLAKRIGISHNHLTRLFTKHLSMTIVEYLRQRRMTMAQHLLENSSMPIKTIAAEVGLADLQKFNKTCRLVLGAAPKKIREGVK